MTLTMLVSGCATGVSDSAICAGTLQAREAHARALLEDAGDTSVVTGATLIQQLDAACNND